MKKRTVLIVTVKMPSGKIMRPEFKLKKGFTAEQIKETLDGIEKEGGEIIGIDTVTRETEK